MRRILRKHGKGIVSKQLASKRLAEIMIDLFVLGRVESPDSGIGPMGGAGGGIDGSYGHIIK